MDYKASDLWEKIKKICKTSVEENKYNMIFKNVEAKDFSDNTLTLICESLLIKTEIEKFLKKIEDAAEILLDESIDVVFEIKKVENNTKDIYKIQEFKMQQNKTNLNKSKTMYNFVIGDNSKLAYEACFAVIDSVTTRDEPAYNPLFIYGGSGLGKTHLMQAVGNAILEKRPDKRVFYVTSEEFSNEYYKVIREHRIEAFRDNFRNLDVLLLDDIQFFEKIFAQGEGKVQEEFFHTFNKLQESGKQIIMISDRYPKDIKNLSERLETRFVQGVTIEMQRPGYETRMQILENFTAMKNIKIEKNILEYIADNVSSNVRELEGVLTTIIARASLLNENITLDQAKDELANRVKTQKAKITAEKIIEVVSQEFTISVSDMKSKKRQAEIVNARQIAMFILKEMLDLNLTSIGGLFGGRDHSTVISSIRKIEEKITEDKIFKNQIDRIKQSITQ